MKCYKLFSMPGMNHFLPLQTVEVDNLHGPTMNVAVIYKSILYRNDLVAYNQEGMLLVPVDEIKQRHTRFWKGAE